MLDANSVVASHHPRPWRKQLNIIAAYLYFYNPLRLAKALVRPESRLYGVDAIMQVIGMWGLTQTIRRTLGWAWRLKRGPIERCTAAPGTRLTIRSVSGGPPDHLPPTAASTDPAMREPSQLNAKRTVF